MSFYKYLFFFYFIFLIFSKEFEYSKNKNIRKENHNLNNVKISNYTSQNEITYLFAEFKKKFINCFSFSFLFWML